MCVCVCVCVCVSLYNCIIDINSTCIAVWPDPGIVVREKLVEKSLNRVICSNVARGRSIAHAENAKDIIVSIGFSKYHGPILHSNAALPHTNLMCEHTRSQIYD